MSNFGTPTASLRLFTVYGPGQRPDMAFSRLIGAALRGDCFPLYGDGRQTRDFTYVGDVTSAMRAAALSGWTGVANIGGGSRTSLVEVIRIVASLAGREVKAEHAARPAGGRQGHGGRHGRGAACLWLRPGGAAGRGPGPDGRGRGRSSHAWNGVTYRHRGGQAWNCVN